MQQQMQHNNNIALITGITGQDGSYLAELLIERGWLVFGIMRRVSVFTTERIEHIWKHPLLRHAPDSLQ